MTERAEGYYWVQMPNERKEPYLALWATEPGREFNETRRNIWMLCGYEIGVPDEDITVIVGPIFPPNQTP